MGKFRDKAWGLAQKIIGSFKAAGAEDAHVTEHGLNMLESLFGRQAEEEYNEKLERARQSCIAGIHSIMTYATLADNKYYELVANDLREVPAAQAYDGEYSFELEKLLDQAKAETKVEGFKTIHAEMGVIATSIQNFLNDDTSDVDYARYWKAKFIDAYKQHMQRTSYDATLSEVMQAYRRYAETGQYLINNFGSENLINATYEAVTDGQNAFEFINKILDYSNTSFTEGGSYNVKVPYAG